MYLKRMMQVSQGQVRAGDQLFGSTGDTTQVLRFVEVTDQEFLVELRNRIKKCAHLLDQAVQAKNGSEEKYCADGALYWLQESLEAYLAYKGFFAENV